MSSPYQALSTDRSSPGASRASSPTRSPSTSLRDLELTESFPHDDDDEDDHGEGGRPKLGRQHRSSTIGSGAGFEFQHALLPLTLSGDPAVMEHHEEKHVGVWHGELPGFRR